MPFSVEFVCGCRVDILQLFLEIWSKMDGAVQVFPNQGIMLDILYEVFLGHLSSCQIFDSIHWHNSDIFYGSQQVLEGDEVPKLTWIVTTQIKTWFEEKVLLDIVVITHTKRHTSKLQICWLIWFHHLNDPRWYRWWIRTMQE